MSVEYRELTDIKEIQTYVRIQREIFNLSEIDTYPPSYFSMLIRKEHPLGIVLGCYIDNVLQGMVVGTAGIPDKSLYVPFVGIKKEYQGSKIAYNLLSEIHERAIKKGFTSIFGIIDPLQVNVGKIYTFFGSEFYKVIPGYANQSKEIYNILFECKLNKYNDDASADNLPQYLVNTLPIINDIGFNHNKFLFEIPNNFKQLESEKPDEALQIRNHTNKILIYYINDRHYKITNCFNYRINGQKKTFYFLEN